MTSLLKQLVLAIPLLFWFCFAYVKGTTAYDYVKELIDFQRKDTTAPSQVHLAFGHDSSQEITVSWVTSDKTESTVSYGPNPWNLDHVATGSSSQYTFRSFYYGSYTSGHIHHVTITGLTPNTKYYYRISAQGAGASAFQPPILGGPIGVADTFTTQPPPGPGAAFEPFSFAVIGDLGQTADSECTVTQVGRDPAFRFVVHAGDLAYADCFQPRWDTFGELVDPVARRLPWMVVPGNHEIEYDAISNTTFLAYEARFRMPQVAPARFLPAAPTSKMDYFSCQPSEVVGCYDFGNSFYSFQAGPVHFLMLNAYTRAGEGSEQLAWVRRDLAAVDRARFPWVVAVTHCPWYHSNAAHHEEPHTAEMRAGLEGLFLRAGVNLVVAGHVHAYERTRPHFQGTPQRGAPIYVTVGDGGNREGHADEWGPAPAWSAYRNGGTFGFGAVTVANATHLLWEWRRDVDGAEAHAVGDAVWVENTGRWAPPAEGEGGEEGGAAVESQDFVAVGSRDFAERAELARGDFAERAELARVAAAVSGR